ncbi:MAG: hypothetical protein K0M69_15665 [Youngiibacter sp.]|nr:hypothetical protein [Youngiibacter sp.]
MLNKSYVTKGRIRTNLTGGYYKMVTEMLKDYGKQIAKARSERDVDKVIDLITEAKSTKRHREYAAARAKKYVVDEHGEWLGWYEGKH